MANAVGTLVTTVSADSLWGVFAEAIPFIGVVVIASFGLYHIKRMLKGIAKGRVKI